MALRAVAFRFSRESILTSNLRHLATTLILTSGVPLPLVSKTLRRAQTRITADLYGHLTAEAALAAADSLGSVLDAAAAELANQRAVRRDHTAATNHDPLLLSGSACAKPLSGVEPPRGIEPRTCSLRVRG